MSLLDDATATVAAWERLQAWGGWPGEWTAENLPRFFWSAMDRLMLAVASEAQPVGWVKANGAGEVVFRQACHPANDAHLGPEWHPVFTQPKVSR